jgi:3-oxoacyl-[acyl-carrier-protein] synthase-3
MRFDVFIAGTGAYLPKEESVETAISQGRYDSRTAERTRQLGATVAEPGERAVDFAVTAARQALLDSGHQSDDVALLLHAVTLDSGILGWNPASYIQRELGLGERCFVSEIRNGCVGGLTAVDFAASHLFARPDLPAAVITAADCYPATLINRWQPGVPIVAGDGGGALVLSRTDGFARILSLASHTDPQLEGANRGDERFDLLQARYPINFGQRANEFLQSTMSEEELWTRTRAGMRAVVDQANADAGLKMSEIDYVVYTFSSYDLMLRACLDPLRLAVEQTTWDFGRRIGHIGAPDVFVGYDHLARSGRLTVGSRALLLCAGTGFVWTAAVIETLRQPSFSLT